MLFTDELPAPDSISCEQKADVNQSTAPLVTTVESSHIIQQVVIIQTLIVQQLQAICES